MYDDIIAYIKTSPYSKFVTIALKKENSMRNKRVLFLSLIALVLAGCLGKAPVTQRSQLVLLSPEQEKSLGQSSYTEFLSKAQISKDAKASQRVTTIGKKIAEVANRDDFNWEFTLVESKEINAFCLPGGKVVVYTGILEIAQNDDQLATVMSHEIAHALARHGAERMSHQQIAAMIQQLGTAVVNAQAPQYQEGFNLAYGLGTQYGVMLPYSRSHEHEADEIGVHLMHKAGYNVDEAVKFWKNMKQVKSQAMPEFLSTHPSDDNRIKKIEKIIKSLK